MPIEEVEVSGRDLAGAFGVSERTIRELADRGIITKVARARYHLLAATKAYTAHLREVSAGRGGEAASLDLTQERARLAREQADAQELKNATARGELVRADAVAAEWSDAIRLMRSNMLAVPARCRQRNSGFGLEETELIRREITEALEAISNDQEYPPASAGDGAAAAADAA